MTTLSKEFELHEARKVLERAKLCMQYDRGEGPFTYRAQPASFWREFFGVLIEGPLRARRHLYDQINYGLPPHPSHVKWAESVIAEHGS